MASERPNILVIWGGDVSQSNLRGLMGHHTPNIGMREQIATIASLLKEQGYATGQFGESRLGPSKERMEPRDDEAVAAATDFIKRANAEGKPWFVWLDATHNPDGLGQAGMRRSPYHDTMIDHGTNVGQMLDVLT